MAYYNLYDLVNTWNQFGFYDVLLPFVLIFTISFGILSKVTIFGTGKMSKNMNVIVALAIAFLFLQNQYLIFVMQRFLPNVSIIMLVFLMFLLVMGIFIGPSSWSGKAVGLAFFAALIAILYALTSDIFYGGRGFTFGDLFTPGNRFFPWMITLVAIIVVVAWVSKDDNDKGVFEGFKNLMEGIKGARPGT